MVGYEFCQWCRTLCQLMLLGAGLFLFMRQSSENRRPSHRFGGETMSNGSLSLESGYIPVRIRRRVLQRDNYHCVWCGREEKRRISYFIQKQAGGETSYHNLVTTCENCKRKRHYDTPSEFISKLKLEELNVFEEVSMQIKVIRPNGKIIEGEVESLPDPTAQAFYLRHPGNGARELIYVEPGMRIVELGAQEKGGNH